MKSSSIRHLTVVFSTAGMLAACEPLPDSETASSATPLVATTVPKGTLTRNVGGAHIMPMIKPGAPPPAAPLLATQLQYYGGHVIANVKVEPVYWGTGTVQTPSDMHGFYAAVTNSSYMDWLSEYDTNITPVGGGSGTNQHIGRGTVDTKDYQITPANTKKSISDNDVQVELAHQIDTGALPAPDENTIYMIHFPLGMHIDLGGSGSCTAFCAYHSTLSKSGKSVYYAVLPYLGTGSGCETGCGGGTLLANHTSVASHELIEAVTDGEIGLVPGSIGPPAAWYDTVSGEIGDICNAVQGTLTGTTYTVQKEWSNQANGCIVDKGTVKFPTVTLTAPTAGATVAGSVTITATATESGDTIGKVDFYVDGTLAGSDTTSPYSLSWDTTKVSNAGHSLIAKATDSHGNIGASSAVSVTVKNSTGTDTTPPVASVTAPSSGSTVSGTVTLTATATDDVAVAKVDFYAGTTLIGTKSAAPYSASWDSTKVSDGSYSLTAKATDTSGNVGTSTAVTVTVKNTVTSGQNEVEPNNTYTTANPVTDPAGQITGYISSSTDTDFFKITVPVGKSLVVDLTMAAASDYDLYVYNTTPTVIAKSENDVGVAEHISVTNTGKTAIARYIEVRYYSGASTTNPYKLSVVIK